MTKPDLALLDQLLEKKPGLLTEFRDDELFTMRGDTILHEALRDSPIEVVEYLIGRDADINAHDDSVIGDTPLDVAMFRGEPEFITLLIESGANPNIPTWMWLTATDRANKRFAETDCTDESERAALRAVMDAAERFPPPIYPDGTVPEYWPPTPDNPHPKRVEPRG